MGSIRKAPRSGRWEARYRDSTGHQRTLTFTRKGEAAAFLASMETDKQRGTWVDPAAGRLPLGEWVQEWWTTTTNLRPSSRARDGGYINRYILPTFGECPLGRVTQLDVRAWVADLDASGLAPATTAKAYQILGKVFAAAVDAGLVAMSPCRRVPLPKVERKEMRFLTPLEVATLADAIAPRYRALVQLGAYGGLRIGEMAGLKRSRVDPLRRRVEVAEVLTEVEGRLHWGQPKTRSGRRSVTIPRSIMDELVAHMERWSGPELVFTAPEGGPLRLNAWRRRVWLPAVRAAGLEPLRVHDLRHSAVALWIASGAKPLEVSRRAGHTSTSFTQDRYGHLFEESEDELADRLGALVVPNVAKAEVLPLREEHAAR